MSAIGETLAAARVRACMIDWVAGLLAAPPSATDVAMLQSAEGRRVCEAMAEELGCAAVMRQLWQALEPGHTPESVALDLSVAYTRLLEGVAGLPRVSLYESTYATTPDRPDAFGLAAPQLFGPAAWQMADLLRHFDLAVGESREPPDHAAIELALYATALRNGDTHCATLLHTRLAGWMPDFISGCRCHDPDGFYGTIALFLDGLLRVSGDSEQAGQQASQQAPQPQQDWSHHAE